MPKTPCKGGIYRITLKIDGRTYVGQTSRDFEIRWREHKSELNLGTHDNPYLQRCWGKYGTDWFEFAVLECIEFIEDLDEAELRWMKTLNSCYQDGGFNLRIEPPSRLFMNPVYREHHYEGVKTDLIKPGDVFGRLTTIEYIRGTKTIPAKWKCICQCGVFTTAITKDLRSGHKSSCGCLAKEGSNGRTHGKSGTPTFWAWASIVQRCTNPKNAAYIGDGVSICEQWTGRGGFDQFFQCLGEKPSPKHFLGRLDATKGFDPLNCKWMLKSNRGLTNRCKIIWEFKGDRHSQKEWSRITGIPVNTLRARANAGWKIEKILTTPPRKMKSVNKSPS